MDIEVTKTKTHETRWSGTLTRDQVAELLLRGLREELGTPHHGMKLEATLTLQCDSGGERHLRVAFDQLANLPFTVVHDADWWSKSEPAS